MCQDKLLRNFRNIMQFDDNQAFVGYIYIYIIKCLIVNKLYNFLAFLEFLITEPPRGGLGFAACFGVRLFTFNNDSRPLHNGIKWCVKM